MGMSDMAEAWWKEPRKPYSGRDFIHIPNSECGHIKRETRNTDTSEYINDINCFACLKLIEQNGNIYQLKEGVSKRQQREIDRKKHKYRFGECKCGSPMRERKNSKTGEVFFGCSNYPKCKMTKSK
jgi:hypothetical protein